MKPHYATRHSKRQIDRILTALKAAGPMSCVQMAEELHLSANSIQGYMAHLREEQPRRVYVSGWAPSAGRRPPIYALGGKPDAPEPPRTTRSDRFKTLKADPVRYKKSLAQRRVCALRVKLKAKPQTWLSALMR